LDKRTVLRVASAFFLVFSLTIVLGLEMTVVNAQEEDSTPPTGSIVINNGREYSNSTSVSLTLTAEDPESGVSSVRFRNEGDTYGNWELPSAVRSWTLKNGDGNKTVYYQIRNNAGLVSATYSDTIVLDTAAPSGSVLINGGDGYTASTSVTLALTATDLTSGVSQVRYSSDGVWDSESWESFSQTKSWTLLSGDGLKTVYYQVRDRAGLSSVYSDSISLATTGPTGSIIINGGDEFSTSRSVTLSLTYKDPVWGIDKVRYSNDGNWDSEQWVSPVDDRSWSLLTGDGNKTVYYQVRNNAGLVSATYSDTIVLDTAAPTGSIAINGGEEFTASTSVTLELIASDKTSGVSQVRYSNSGEWGSELDGWESFSPSKSWTLTSEDGTKTVYYQVRDNAGLSSSVFSDSIYLSTVTPTGSVVINSGDNYTASRSVTLTLTYTASVSGVSGVRYSNDGVWNSEPWEEPSSTKSWTLLSGDGVKTVYYQIRNSAGMVSSTYSDTIILDTTEPTGSILIDEGEATAH